MRRRSLLLFTPVICAVVGFASGAAYAYFTGSGHGTGSASVGTMQTVTISSATVSPGTKLLPGGTGEVTLEVNNPNTFAVTLVSVTLVSNGTITGTGGVGSCSNTGVTFAPQNGLNTRIPPGGPTEVDLLGAASMGTGSDPGCQGATFSIPVTITVQGPTP